MRINLVGEVFGRLRITSKAGVSRHGHTIYLCSCSCGSTGSEILSHNLLSGKATSCGCLRNGVDYKPGQTFNNLMVLEPWGCNRMLKKGYRLLWCGCNCGNPHPLYVRAADLTNGKVKDCGGCTAYINIGHSTRLNRLTVTSDIITAAGGIDNFISYQPELSSVAPLDEVYNKDIDKIIWEKNSNRDGYTTWGVFPIPTIPKK